jgi:hypothetical protein
MKIAHQIICMFAMLKDSLLKIEESVIIALREQLMVRIIVHSEKSSKTFIFDKYNKYKSLFNSNNNYEFVLFLQ